MKKILCLLVVVALLLCGCATKGQKDKETPAAKGVATEADIARLEKLYDGREVFHGEFHDHANTGGIKSDGKTNLEGWKVNMIAKDMDFTTIVDHKQQFHMELPEWDETMFIGGSEPGTRILDLPEDSNSMHYNMVFATAEEFDKFLTENDAKFNFKYNVGGDGYFFYDKYESYTSEQLMELAEAVREYGGFFNHNHPLGDEYLKSDDPLDYWYGDYTGFEVFEGFYNDMNDRRNQAAYDIWLQMLRLGKKVYATAGSDSHNLSKTISLSTVYAEQRHASSWLSRFRQGDFTAGPVGIRMCIGDTVTGGETDFTGKRLVVAVGDFHSQETYPYTYRVDVYNERGKVHSQEFKIGETVYVALDTEDCMYYRAEVYSVTGNVCVAIGNPIWNTQN